jgi:hypothetical protein
MTELIQFLLHNLSMDCIENTASHSSSIVVCVYKLKLNSPPWPLVRKQTIPTERPPLVGEVSANLADRGCRVVSATDPPGR